MCVTNFQYDFCVIIFQCHCNRSKKWNKGKINSLLIAYHQTVDASCEILCTYFNKMFSFDTCQFLVNLKKKRRRRIPAVFPLNVMNRLNETEPPDIKPFSCSTRGPDKLSVHLGIYPTRF